MDTGDECSRAAGGTTLPKLTGEERFYEVGEEAFNLAAQRDMTPWGKGFAQLLTYAPGTMSLLQEWRSACC